MRRWLMIFLLLVIPFQSVWAAAAPYCAHEKKVSAKAHFGHHEHQHQADDGTSPAADDDSAGIGAYHADCESCHLGTNVASAPSAMVIGALPHRAVGGDPYIGYQSHISSGPERPDRIERAAAA